MQKFKILRQIINFFTPQYLIVRGQGGGVQIFFLIAMLFYRLVRSPKLKSYDKPLQGFEQRYPKKKNKINFRQRRWGSSLPCPRTRDPPLSPPSALAEIFRHACLQSCLQTSPTTPQKSDLKFQNSTTIFEFLSHPLCHSAGGGGSLTFLFYWNLNN